MMNQDFKMAGIVAVVLTALSYVVAAIAGWITGIVWLEAGAVFASYACTYLVIKQRRFQYVIGAIATVLFALLFWKFGLIGSALLNIYLTIQLIYGWFRWRRDDNTRPVTHVTLKTIPLYIIATVAMFFGGQWIITAAGGAMAGWDTVILLLSLLAQWLLDNKKIETWIVWTVVNLIQIPVYFIAGLPLTAIQYVLFLAMNFLGWRDWWNSIPAGCVDEEEV